MTKLVTLSSLLLLFVFLTSAAFSQGVLRGTVSDSVTGDQLAGANVYLSGTALGAPTDREGKYRITGIPPGQYTVRISYIGFTPRAQVLSLTGEETVLNVALMPEVVEGQEVVVTAQRRGQVAAINQQITSATVVSVVSEEKIKELPDANAAEALGRLPGVSIIRSGGEATKVTLRGLSEKYSTITVDGARISATDSTTRDVDLSMIAQSSLAGIELFKALTPDMDADAIAGSVNLVTKKAPATRTIQVDGAGNYNALNNTARQYDFYGRYGERFFDGVLGVQLSGNVERKDRSSEDYTIAYDLNFLPGGVDYAITNFILDYTREIRKRAGASLLLDIDTPDSGSVRINAVYNRTDRDYVLYTRNYPTTNTPVNYTARDREQDIDMVNTSLRGTNYLLGLTTTWGLSFAQSRSEFPFDVELDFFEPPISQGGVPIAGMGRIPASAMKGPPENLVQYGLNNFQAAYLNWGYSSSQKNMDINKSASLDLTREYSFGAGIAGTLKIGGRYRIGDRLRDVYQLASPYYIDPFRQWTILPDGTIGRKLLTSFVGTRFAHLATVNDKVISTNFLDTSPEHRSLYDRYDLFPLISADALRLWWDLNRRGVRDSLGNGPEYSANLEASTNAYAVTERVGAAYVMNTLNLGPDITLIAGLRVENDDNSYRSKYSIGALTGFPTPVGNVGDTSAAHRETIWLPNFHLTIRPTSFMSIRLAAYKALARPDFNQRLNSFIARNAGGGTTGVVLYAGNPNLRNAQSWNYEVNTSFFSNTIGLLSLSAYYKKIDHLPLMLNGVLTKGQGMLDSLGINWKNPFLSSVDYNLTFPVNASRASRAWGFELEHQANLSFLPGLLSNLILSYNLSLAGSETFVVSQITVAETTMVFDPDFGWTRSISYRRPLVQNKQRIPTMPEFYGNVSLGYDIGGFSARVSVFHQGEYNQIFSFDQRSDVVVDAFTRWDFAAKYQVTDYLALIFNLNNFTNAKEGTTTINRVRGWTLPTTSQRYGMSGNLGVRLLLE